MKARFAFFALLSLTATAPAAADDALLCLRETARIEKKEGIQKNLLSAISLVETGRYRKEYPTGVAWPWTVRTAEKGMYFDTKEAAIAYVRQLRENGEDSIDVGCMQINLKFHPDAFKDLDEAFDPAKNIAYAVTFLKRNYKETRSWGAAATQYHSKNAEKAMKYEDLLLGAWNRLSKHGNPAEKAGAVPAPARKTAVKKDLPRRAGAAKSDKRKADVVLPGSEEAKRRSAEWRKRKIEEYMSRRRAPDSEEPVFEDSTSASSGK